MIPVQNQNIPFTLVGKHMFLGLQYSAMSLCTSKWLGSQIGHYLAMWPATVHVHELEGAELHHRQSEGAMRPHLRQKGLANVPPTQTDLPCRPEHLSQESRGGGLPRRSR